MQARILERCIPEPNSGCWLWLRQVNSVTGYGYVPLGKRGRRQLAHRASYEAFVGPIPDGLHIDHRCKTRSCVNPHHLEAVTQLVNNQRQTHNVRFTGVTHCVNGHEFTEENTYQRPTGGRSCKTCVKQRGAAHYRRNAKKN